MFNRIEELRIGKNMAQLSIKGMEADNLRRLLDHHAKSVDDFKRLSTRYRRE